MGSDSHGNNGHSHSHTGCFPFLPIPIPNFVTNSHYHAWESHGISIPIGNPIPMVISSTVYPGCCQQICLNASVVVCAAIA